MQDTVSAEYLTAVAAKDRQTTELLYIEWTRNATEPAVHAVSSSGQHSATYLPDDDVANGLAESFPYCVCDCDCLADGTWFPFPEAADAEFERGWWSDVTSEGDKKFTVNPWVEVDFATGAPWRKANIISVLCPSYYNGFIKFKLWYKRSTDSSWQDGTEYTMTSRLKEVELGSVLDLKAVKIEITETFVASDYARLTELDAIWREDISGIVEKMKIQKRREYFEETMLPYGMFAASELEVDLLEETGKFKGSGAYTSYMGPNLRLLPYIGVWTGAAFEYVAQGVFYSEDDWKLSERMGVSFSARDAMKYHQERDCEKHLVTAIIASKVFQHIFYRGQACKTDMSVEAFSTTYSYVYFADDQTVFDAASALAEAELATFYYDELGILQIDNKDHFSGASSVATITDAELFEANIKEPNRANHIQYNYMQSNLALRQKVYDSSEEITLAAHESRWINGDFDKPPVPYVSSPSVTADADISVGLWSSNGIAWRIYVTNSAASAKKITGIVFYGRPLSISDDKHVISQDSDLERRQGKRTKEVGPPILSMTAAQAQARSDAILARLKSGSRQINVPMRSQPHWQTGDVVTVSSTRAGISADYFIQAINDLDKSNMELELIKL